MREKQKKNVQSMYNRTNTDLKNPYVSLEVDSNIIRNDVKTNTVSETKISDIDNIKRITNITQ
jgi:hypothetical protein